MTTLKPLGPSFYQAVQDRLRARLDREGFDGLLALDTHNVIYLTGFFHSANERPIGVYLPVLGEPVLFVPHLEAENAEGIVADVRTYAEFPGVENPILWMIRASGARRLAVDTLPARLIVEATGGVSRLEPTDMVAEARFRKTPEELVFVRAAAGFADICLEAIRERGADIVRGGGTEQDLLAHGVGAAHAALMIAHGEALGGTKLGITASVHSGPRAALPHGKTSTRVPQPGDTLICGIGASVGGYHAESGVTFFLGEPTADQRRAFAAMAAANSAAVTACRPGNRCDHVNTEALAEIERAGFAPYIRHRIGHGMGLQGHEAPWLAPGDGTIVSEGMVFSNEPGIYRPGVDGYRTINTMIVGNDTTEVPSRFQARHDLDARVIAL